MPDAAPEAKAVMIALMEPTPENEEEFNDWYDTEHFPERIACPGFLTGARLVCIEGWPRYAALYDLDGFDVFKSPEYLSFSGKRPWSKRVRSKVRGLLRWTGTSISPGARLTGAGGYAARIMVLRFSGIEPSAEPKILSAFTAAFSNRADVAQARLFRPEFPEDRDYLGIVESRSAGLEAGVGVAALGDAAPHLDMMNTYIRYMRGERVRR